MMSAKEVHPQQSSRSESSQPGLIKFTSLGLVVLDEIHFCNGETKRDVIGGSGAYSLSNN